jgi:hypothetical protein
MYIQPLNAHTHARASVHSLSLSLQNVHKILWETGSIIPSMNAVHGQQLLEGDILDAVQQNLHTVYTEYA